MNDGDENNIKMPINMRPTTMYAPVAPNASQLRASPSFVLPGLAHTLFDPAATNFIQSTSRSITYFLEFIVSCIIHKLWKVERY
jgi:hypothetical protein